ncbi:MAG: hypothetical protein ACNA78_03320 [Balneolaceae bacterium]
MIHLLLFAAATLFAADSYPVGEAAERDQRSGNRLALSIAADSSPQQIEQQLQLASEMGILILEIEDVLPVQLPDDHPFFFFLSVGEPHATAAFSQNRISGMAAGLQGRFNRLSGVYGDRVLAASLFHYPNSRHPEFPGIAAALTDSLELGNSTQRYYHTYFPAESALPPFQFVSVQIQGSTGDELSSPVAHFLPESSLRNDLQVLEKLLHASRSYENSVIVLPGKWTAALLQNRPEFKPIFQRYMNGDAFTFPLPAPGPADAGINMPVLLIFLMWAITALMLRFHPVFRQSNLRYFVHHSFFVEDVADQRYRHAMPGVYLALQHAIGVGLFCMILIQTVLSNNGLAILSDYFPVLFYTYSPSFSFFMMGFLAALLLTTISIAWIYLGNKELKQLHQAINFYAWPLQLNLIIITLVVVVSETGVGHRWLPTLGVLFLFIWFSSFNMAAFDSGRFLSSNRFLYLMGTVGLHVILIAGSILYLYLTPQILEPIRFALSVP